MMEEESSFSHTFSEIEGDDNANVYDKKKRNSEFDDELERRHFQRILKAFRNYKSYCCSRLQASSVFIASLPKRHQVLLSGHQAHLEQLQQAVLHNDQVLQQVVKDAPDLFLNAVYHTNYAEEEVGGVLPQDMEKVESTLKQLFREWSKEGAEEREASFGPILREIQDRFPCKDPQERSRVRVLVPGAGLGRLPYEVARMGYSCEGNEFSFFMLFTSNFVINQCCGVNLHYVFPWVHQQQNVVQCVDALHQVSFPDVDPSALPPGPDFSMAAGSFLEIYKKPESWDCIATCFFLDTAPNVVECLEVVWCILRPGGLWVNLGPLLYHHREGRGVQLSYEELRGIITHTGFHILKEDFSLATPYAQNPRSMMRHEYRSVFFVCHKVDPPSS